MPRTTRVLALALTMILLASAAQAGKLDGVIKLGGIWKDEQAANLSAVPETYNIYEGFSVSKIDLRSQLHAAHRRRPATVSPPPHDRQARFPRHRRCPSGASLR